MESRSRWASLGAVAAIVAASVVAIVAVRRKRRATRTGGASFLIKPSGGLECATTTTAATTSAAAATTTIQLSHSEDEPGIATTLGIMHQSDGHYRCEVDRTWCGIGEVSYQQLCSSLDFCLQALQEALRLRDAARHRHRQQQRSSISHPQLCKMEKLLQEVKEQVTEAPELWLRGRSASVRELCTRVEGLRPAQPKLQLWFLAVKRHAAEVFSPSEALDPEREKRPDLEPALWPELDRLVPMLRSQLASFLDVDISPEELLVRDAESFKALAFCLQQLATEPYDNPLDQDSHYANCTTQDTRRKN
ncbi:unnamed protein product [Polarella glacialis]|uniref:Uncharacterized protein n=1 Tax=Polarella glacialis TaxID=89957 RepID=A0A813E5N6_POLGL|nr:unnamed protein product [Polarella glacialis]